MHNCMPRFRNSPHKLSKPFIVRTKETDVEVRHTHVRTKCRTHWNSMSCCHMQLPTDIQTISHGHSSSPLSMAVVKSAKRGTGEEITRDTQANQQVSPMSWAHRSDKTRNERWKIHQTLEHQHNLEQSTRTFCKRKTHSYHNNAVRQNHANLKSSTPSLHSEFKRLTKRDVTVKMIRDRTTVGILLSRQLTNIARGTTPPKFYLDDISPVWTQASYSKLSSFSEKIWLLVSKRESTVDTDTLWVVSSLIQPKPQWSSESWWITLPGR